MRLLFGQLIRKKIAAIVSAIVKTTYSTLRDLYSPTNQKDKTYM